MSIEVVFAAVRGGASHRIEVEQIFFHGEVLRETKSGPELARHESHAWRVTDGRRFFRLDVQQGLVVSFGHADGHRSRFFGPYSHFSCVDGIAYVERRVLAFVDEQRRDWYSVDLGSHWADVYVDQYIEPDENDEVD